MLGIPLAEICIHQVIKYCRISGAVKLSLFLLFILLLDIKKQVAHDPVSTAAKISKQVKEMLKLRQPGEKELHPFIFPQKLPPGFIQRHPDLRYPFRRQAPQLGIQLIGVPKLLLPPGKEDTGDVALSFLFAGLHPAGADAGQAGFIVTQQSGDLL